MLVKLNIDKTAAILAGSSDAGIQTLDLDVSILSQDLREELALCARDQNQVPAINFHPDTGTAYMLGATWSEVVSCLPDGNARVAADAALKLQVHRAMLPVALPDLPKYPTAQKLSAEEAERILRERIRLRAEFLSKLRDALPALQEAAANLERAEQQRQEKKAREYASNPFSLYKVGMYPSCVVNEFHDDTGRSYKAKEYSFMPGAFANVARFNPQLADELAAELRANIDKANRAERRTSLEKVIQKEKLAAERQAILDGWIAELGTAEQQERHAEGLLPEAEALEVARAAIFKPYADFRRYQKMSADSVAGSTCAKDEYTSCGLEFETSNAEDATARQFALLKAVRAVQSGHDSDCKLELNPIHLDHIQLRQTCFGTPWG